MELHYRRFKDLRSNVAKKKSQIAPYDSTQLAEKFKQEFLVNIKKLESEIQQVLDQNQSIIDHNQIEQDFVDARKMKLEDRMIALLSFHTVILFYSRFLDSRQMDAKGQLSDPVDDIDSIESQIQNAEKIVNNLKDQLNETQTKQLEDDVTFEQNKMDELASSQMLQKHQLKFRKLLNDRELKAVQKQSMQKTLPKKKYHINFNELLTDCLDYDKMAAEQNQTINFTNMTQKAERFRENQVDLQLLERKYNDFVGENTKLWREKAAKLKEVSDTYHEIADIYRQIDQQSIDNSVLRFQFAKMNDESAEEKRAAAYIEYLKVSNRRRETDIIQAKERISEMKTILKKRRRHCAKKDKSLFDLKNKINTATEEKNEYEAKVIALENTVFNTQMKLNLKLKECQTLSSYHIPPELFNEKGKTIPRLEEMSKVMEIVAIEKTEKDQ